MPDLELQGYIVLMQIYAYIYIYHIYFHLPVPKKIFGNEIIVHSWHSMWVNASTVVSHPPAAIFCSQGCLEGAGSASSAHTRLCQ